MRDRELLELAAKAYWGEEIDDVCSIRWLDSDKSIGYTHGDNQDHNGRDVEWLWNPLTDDGDALRLAVKLGASIISGTYKAVCEIVPQEDGPVAYKTENYGDDSYAATRRAIVRAAAEIGKVTK